MSWTAEVTVSRALPSDAVVVEALLDEAATWMRSRGVDQWTPGQFREEVQETIAEGSLHVARHDGDIVGCFLLDDGSPEWMEEWLVERGRVPTHGANVGRLAVARDAAGHRLGVKLLEAASQLAAERGLAWVRLDCPAGNARLRRYYLDAGFSCIGDIETRGPNGERWVSSVFERATGAKPTPSGCFEDANPPSSYGSAGAPDGGHRGVTDAYPRRPT